MTSFGCSIVSLRDVGEWRLRWDLIIFFTFSWSSGSSFWWDHSKRLHSHHEDRCERGDEVTSTSHPHLIHIPSTFIYFFIMIHSYLHHFTIHIHIIFTSLLTPHILPLTHHLTPIPSPSQLELRSPGREEMYSNDEFFTSATDIVSPSELRAGVRCDVDVIMSSSSSSSSSCFHPYSFILVLLSISRSSQVFMLFHWIIIINCQYHEWEEKEMRFQHHPQPPPFLRTHVIIVCSIHIKKKKHQKVSKKCENLVLKF